MVVEVVVLYYSGVSGVMIVVAGGRTGYVISLKFLFIFMVVGISVEDPMTAKVIMTVYVPV